MMAQPLLDFLTGRARQALPYLRAAAKEGLTATAAFAQLAEYKLTFQRQRALDVYNALLGRVTLPQNRAKGADILIRLVPSNVPVPDDLHFKAPTNLGTPYQYVINTINVATDEEEYLTVSSQVPLATALIRQLGAELFQNGNYFEGGKVYVSPESINIEEYNKSPNAP